MKKKLSHRFVAFSYRDFRLLWVGQLISIVGSQMQTVAIGWHIYTLTHSPIALGLIGLTGTIPLVVISLLAGSFADRYDRKKVIYITQIFLLILTFILALSAQVNFAVLPAIYLVVALGSIGNAFYTPAMAAYIPRTVREEHYPNAISLNFSMRQASYVAGSALAGFVIAYFGVVSVYFINAISYFSLIILMHYIKAKGKVDVQAVSQKHLSAIHEGFAFIRSRTIIWSTILLDFVSTFFSSATSLLPLFAKDVLHVGPQELGFLYAAPAIGAVTCGAVMSYLGKFKNEGKVLLSAVAFYGVATIMFGMSRLYFISFIA
ncbi:MFS transporter [Candidatus Roizmanbacteria bacterium]|nr:MFS transporter [Candidatus Roizmanbacteria bacterium]